MRGRFLFPLIFLLILFCAGVAHADEIRLKDGSKIVGTIVGFENDSFRVETSYGFALIQKDQVADITITPSKKDVDAKAKPVASAPQTSPANSGGASAVAKESAAPAGAATPTSGAPPAANAAAPMRPPNSPAVPAAASAKPDTTAPKVATAAAATPAPPPVAPPAPPPAPEPPPIRDEVRGNEYLNHTYGFQMYKPPSWDLIPGARKALPDAVAALGTNDQTTLMVIGREQAKDSLDAHASNTEKALKDVYENYRLISTRHLSVAGLPAVEQRSRGTADGRDWSVTLLTLLRGNDAYTLLGMTWADSDLIQVQENVISKAVNSLTFVNP
jgi:hypothetical protein